MSYTVKMPPAGQHEAPSVNYTFRTPTAGRLLKALAIGRGNLGGAMAFASGQGHWEDRADVVEGIKAAISAIGTNDYGTPAPIAESFLAAMRDFSVPLRLAGLKRVPMKTRIYANAGGVVAVRVDQGTGTPVLRGSWTQTELTPIKHRAVIVTSEDLVRSMSATASNALVDDLAQATAEAENLSFLSPDQAGSVLYGAPTFTSAGTTLANIDSDLERLLDLVPGCAAFAMTESSATHLSFVRGTGGARAYPDITPRGGTLQGLPVLVTKACRTDDSPVGGFIAALAPTEIFFADEGQVVLSATNEALLEMDSAPTGEALGPTAAQNTLVSLWQSESTALRAARESSWYARSGAGAYFEVSF